MKPLTIEELKSLEVGDWVWIETPQHTDGQYLQVHYGGVNSIQCYKVKNENELLLLYSDYGKTWLAYKNKEQAEAKGEIEKALRECFYKAHAAYCISDTQAECWLGICVKTLTKMFAQFLGVNILDLES
ncbi:MAG: hypothetical protein K2O94_06330 [Clostridiales bacterium]|nr:hypothetical protein [Clostridiales bacterium]